ncbi:MAG: IdeS/Mac family cysteine endopeptidase [Akkermansia sp.]|nr:IdeS/Mac family cysteine endopeptidase [Akkermansia sp.]
MMRSLLLSSLLLLTSALLTPAAEVWAPGVSRESGWYDYHKNGSNDGTMADTAMCWAASASNVISWWQNLNSSSLETTVPKNEKIFDTFRGVFSNGGGKAKYAYDWWVNTNGWGAPEGAGWAAIDKGMPAEYVDYANGGFLYGLYDTSAYPITIATSSNNPYTYSEAVVKALGSGYALTLSVENSGIAHAYTLWGAEYEITTNGYELTALWLTNSDDIYNEPQLYREGVKCTYVAAKDSGSVAFDGNMGATLMEVAGLRVDPALIPEPSSAALGLVALVALLHKRRRRA